jgi:hypothetical protein
MAISVPNSALLFLILMKISQTLQAEIQTDDFEKCDNNANHYTTTDGLSKMDP